MRKTKKQRFRASILAILLIASMVFGMVPNSVGQVYAKESTSSSSEEEPGFIDKAINFFQDTGDKIASFFGAGDEAAPAAAFDTTKEADENTLQEWQEIAKETTENIGRIWTDKTVSTTDMEFEAFSGDNIPIGNSQFLVALSALSSTSNTVTTSSKPLDIVLVLDVSGSMEDPLGTVDVYNEEYDINTGWRGPAYFAKVNDEYVQIDRKTSLGRFSHWELNGVEVAPKTSANDSTEGHIQFYTKKTQNVSKMDALKNAVNGFIEATAKENDQIQDKTKQHNISVVKFADDSYNESYGDDLTGDDYNYTQRLNALTSYTSGTVSELTDKVNSLQEAGATSADYGLTMAQTELKANGRKDAQKVVIFFTDGEPNHSNGFSNTVANAAISKSQELKKNEKAIVYSVGVFKDADPSNASTSDANRFNAYMHGISSNYPEATKWNSLGTRVENSNYYKAASNADDLNKIFEDILQDVNSGSGFPTDIQDGYEPNKGGYVTFDDKLGAYMQVDEFKSIIFADQKFDLNRNTGVKTEGNVTTYTFEGESGNSLYPNGNLHDILITVTKSADLAVGDQVKVQIPASMIPLRHFNVDTDAAGKTTMEVTSARPIRIVYGASIKPGVEETLRDGLDDSAADQALETYLRNNQANINGKAAAFFYSNLYTGKPWQGHDGKTLGDTVASFDPAKGNIFYYFTENTPIYTDEEFTQPVKGEPVSGDTYYYKKVFWELENGTPVEKTIAYPFASDNFNQASASWATNEKEEVYIRAGSAKLTRVDALTLSKANNITNTATEIINPQWDNVNNPQTLQVYLGNNGRIAMEVPGALEIAKDATVAADKNLNEEEIVKDKEFTFNISIPEMKGKTVKAEKRNLQGDIQGNVFDLIFDGQGKTTGTLKDNEKLYIHGLDAGAEYTVTEDTNSMPAGFKLTAIDGKKATEATEATGTIVAGSPKQHTFTNTYDVTATSVEAFAPYEKVFDRWDQAPKFQIMLKADDLSCPMPAESTNGQKVVEVTQNNSKGNFGTITYNKPGTYGYTVIELLEPNDQVIGVDYSLASYDVEVKVSDTGKGTLQVDSVVMRQQNTDDGASIAEPAEVRTATFKNTYNLDSASLAAIVSKNYTDTTGASLTSGQFEFKMTPRKDLDEGTNDPTNNRPKLPQDIQPDENGSIFVKNTGNVANFGYATYDTTCVGNTYAYELTEVVPKGVTVESPKLNGMTYDLQRYLVKMKVTSEKVDGKDAVRVTPTYYVITENAGEETYTEYTPGGTDPYPVFHNTYDPEDLELPSEGNDAIHGSKTLKGRDSLEGETFTFTLSAANEASKTALENDWIVFEGDANKTDMTATVTAIQNGVTENFNFGKVKFTRPGVYQFNVVENAPENGKGMVYDRHTALVTVTVTDNAGKLEGKVTYNNGQGASTSEAAFTNTYTASTTYGDGAALNLSKTLNGRNQAIGEFNFQIAGQNEAAEQKLADTDRKFATIARANDGVASVIFDKMSGVRFTEADAGTSFSYVVKEVLPEDDDADVAGVQSKGVTYTQTQYRVDIQVNDNGDGTMSTVTTVSRTHDEKGVLLQQKEELGTYNSKDGKANINDISFVNSYAAKSVTVNTDTDANVKLTKQLKGRSWKGTDKFDFTLTATNPADAPLPVKDGVQTTTAAVTQPEGTAEDTVVKFGFGTITFDKPGDYYYQVTEEHAGKTIDGIRYDDTLASVWVSVEDPGDGQLTATVSANETDFVNTYAASLRHNAAGGIVTTKTLTGHDMEKQQFTFQVEALAGTGTTAEENAKRIGIKEGTTGTYRNDQAAADGTKITMKTEDGNDIEFTTDDVGKTFKYQFSEMGADGQFETGGTKDGYTYDKTVYTVEMWVTDDGDGTLTLHTKVNDGEEVLSDEKSAVPTVLDFTNRYAASGTLTGATNLAGTKKMDGPWEATDKDLSGFQFTITGGDEATNAAIAAGTVVLPEEQTVTSDAQGNFNFGDITFKKKGTYQFKVSEVVPEDEAKIPGVAYDASPVTITVHVTDNDKGTLTAVLAENSPELTFTNTYATTQDATFSPSVVKKVEGLDAKESFTFKLSAADEATKKAINDKDITGIGTVTDSYSSEETTTDVITKGNRQTVNFNELTFKKAGTYKFTVKETNANAPTGWTYDDHTYEITINVTDVASKLVAQMEATDLNTNSPIFTNRFKATTSYDEEGGLNVTKKLNERTLKEDMFDFTITGETTNSVKAEEANKKLAEADKNFKNTAPGEDGVAVMSKLGNMKFDETDIGKTYQYEVREVAGTDTKYTYDQVPATVAIQVLEKDGGLYTVTTVTKEKDVKTYSSENGKVTAVAPFVNSYTPDIVTIEPGASAGNVTKVLKGNRNTVLAAGEFNFQMTITAKDGSDMAGVVLPEGAIDGTVTAANAADGSVSFGNIQFKAAGNYHVEIREVIPENADPNMTYDQHTFSYDIEVTYDAGTGELSAKAVENSQSGSPTFTNIYEEEDAKDVANTTEPTTSVNGKIVGVGDQLTYTIDWVNNAVDTTGAPAKAEVKITDVVPEGTKYVSADNQGTYDKDTNTITWNLGEQEAGASGTVSFVVEVLDSAGGTEVTNTAEITIGKNAPNQTNTVTTKVPGKDSAVEEGGELQVGKVLTYTISYMNPEEEAATVTIKDIIPKGLDYVEGSAGEFASYNAETRTLTWTLENIAAGETGTVEFKAKVNESAETVIDNKATIQIGDNAPTYDTNTDQNEIPKDGNLAISKTIALAEGQGTEIDKTKSFTFKVELKDAKGAALRKEYAYTVTGENGEEIKKGNATNDTEISFQHGQKAVITRLPAGAQYTVTETEAGGYTTSVNGQAGNAASGMITADATAAVDFTNTYSVSGSLSGSDALTVTKKLVGREWLDTDKFAYKLTPADEATKTAVEDRFITLPENAGNLEITKESAEHQAAFGDIQFTIAGTFKFNVTERPSGIAGITDDKNAERTVVVKVTDKKDGTLEAIVDGKSENLTFTNTYGAGTGEEDIAAKIPATKKLTGRDMKADEFQFEVVTRKADEEAEGFKEEVVATGTNAAAQADKVGTVTFAGKDDVKLTYTVESLNKAVEAGYAVKEVKEGQSVWTVSYTARELTDKLPGGVTEVEGKTSYDFTIVVTDNNDGTLTVVPAPEGGIAFENAYKTGGTEVDTDPTDEAAYFNKKLVGRDWLGTDEFTFTITPQGDAPSPEGSADDGTKTVSVTSDHAKADESVPFGFGKITFTDADMAGATPNEDGTLSKTFTYQITENDINAEKMPGVTKDNHEATLTITVTDNQQGELSASAIMTAENGTFTNTYKSSLDYTALSGLQITKVLNGRDMADGQFTFTVTPEDKASADKLGLTEGATEFTNTAKPAGETDTMDVLAGKNVIFTQADAGKTFTYTVAEKAGDNSAYTYDDTTRTVTIKVKDNKNATLTVTTTVKKGSEVVDTQSVTTGGEGQKATVAFENTYNANPTTLGGEGNVKINAKKSLTNRPMVDGEFTFRVLDKNQNRVTSGTNSAEGTITFDPVTYDTDKLIADEKAGIAKKSVQEGAYVYTYDYTVVEAPTAEGVTGDATTFAIQVIVTDQGDGTLELKVQYPEGTDSLAFKNLYGEGAEAEITINGHKQYEVASGDNEPDITGKYTFTITGSEGAPMPEKTEVTNDTAGNVNFGAITYTMENVFGDTGSKPEVAEAAEGATEDEAEGEAEGTAEAKSAKREKTFTYTVAESGSVPGVQNDGSSKTFTVTVTDNGNGTIAVEKSWKENEFPFSFTNTYSVTPVDYSINTDLTINKELDGRELREGEFTFELVSEDGKVVSTATNSADGSVAFQAITYKTPGTYNYVIREQKGSAGGVEYDSAEHTVVVVVTDNGDGTMTAKAELKSRDGEDAKNAIVFKNSYTAQPASVTLGASKAYTGGKLGDGQFTFELRDESDKLISKAKNNENGQIVFETIEYKNVGTYKYKISEVNDEQKHVTYDKTVYGVTVTVTDNGEGSLMATVEYDGGKAPVFTNKYSKPAKPAKPEEPKGPTAVKTGDEAPVIPFIILMVATLAIIVTITFIFFRRKRR